MLSEKEQRNLAAAAVIVGLIGSVVINLLFEYGAGTAWGKAAVFIVMILLSFAYLHLFEAVYKPHIKAMDANMQRLAEVQALLDRAIRNRDDLQTQYLIALREKLDEIGKQMAQTEAPSAPTPPVRPCAPPKDAGVQAWLDYYHKLKEAGFKTSFTKLAEESSYSAGHLKNVHEGCEHPLCMQKRT